MAKLFQATEETVDGLDHPVALVTLYSPHRMISVSERSSKAVMKVQE